MRISWDQKPFFIWGGDRAEGVRKCGGGRTVWSKMVKGGNRKSGRREERGGT